MSEARITLIVAMDAARGIGIDNRLPWHLPEDLAHFKRVTLGHPIIMGRKTFDSIGRPLPKRRNVVVTRNPAWSHEGVEHAGGLPEAVALVGSAPAFIIGGAQVFAEAMPLADRMIVTEIAQTFDCDTFFPPIDPAEWREAARERHQADSGLAFDIVTYERVK